MTDSFVIKKKLEKNFDLRRVIKNQNQNEQFEEKKQRKFN